MNRRLLPLLVLLGSLAWSCTRDEQGMHAIRTQQENTLSVPKSVASKPSRPRFEDYPILRRFKGPVAKLNINGNSEAQKYRAVLREGTKLPPTFAGQCAVTLWGCGSPCTRFAIVDLKSGNVFVAPEPFSAGIDFRLNSELLILEPPAAVRELCQSGMDAFCDSVYSFYYRWNGQRLVLIDSVLVDSTRALTSPIKQPPVK